jgi:4-amino-4-deoxy-L-arabinose transferase-like glycosyltransferase
MAKVATERESRLSQMPHLGAVICLVVFHLVNNWIFVSTQVTILGWDRPAHLIRTLIYNDMLQQVNLRSLFEVLTWSWNRPPLAHLTAVPLYRLFGVSTDVALMRNAVYVVILLLSVYGIGRRMYNARIGLLAAFIVSTYPILFSISRMPYIDYALTAMAALCIYLLVACDGFRRRGYSLLLGLIIGLGILTKWPFIAFSGGPLAYVAVRSGSLRDIKVSLVAETEVFSILRRLWASPLLHLGLGLCLTLIWYWPNRDRLGAFILGYWLIPLSWLLVSFTLYVLSRPPRQGANLLSAMMVGATVGSLWSLPNLTFSERFVTVVYSGLNMEGVGLGPLNPAFYFRYLSFLPGEQLSPFYFIVLLVALGLLIYPRWRQKGVWDSLKGVSDSMWILLLWFGVSMLIFTFSLTMNSRFDVGLLPPLALISARGLYEIKTALIRRAVISIVILVGLVQFFALSYDDLDSLRNVALVNTPWGGKVNLLAEGSYIELPASGRNHEGYFIGPQVLDLIEEDMLRDGKDAVQLGNLVNRSYSNNAIFQYLMYDAYPGMELREFARSGWEDPPIYERIFECDYLLMKSSPYQGLREEAQEAMKIIESSPSFFNEAFQVIWEYTLPDGDIIYLYKKQHHLQEGYDGEDYRLVADEIESLSQERGGIILTPPAQVEVLGRHYLGHLPLYPLPEQQPLEEQATHEELERIVTERERVFLVLWDGVEDDPNRFIEHWLNEHAYRAWDAWHGAVQLVLYGTSHGEGAAAMERSMGASLGEAVRLEGFWLLDEEIQGGDILRFTLHWRAVERVQQDYKVFAHLMDEGGTLVAQRDSEPVGGSRPTTTWDAEEEILDNYGILIPDGLEPGEYFLVVGMYRPATGERLSVSGESVQTVDSAILLDAIMVTDE